MAKIKELEEELKLQQNIVREKDAEIVKLTSQISDNNSQISELNNLKDNLQKDIELKDLEIKDLKIRIKEEDARRFSKSFKVEKEELGKEKAKWQNLSILSAILGIGITFIVVFSSFYLNIEDKFSLIMIEGLTISLIIYIFKQFSYYSQHYTDALRREALAQGYQNILEGGEDGLIEEDYKKRLLDVLCKNEIKDNHNKFPQEKIFDKLIETIDILKSK